MSKTRKPRNNHATAEMDHEAILRNLRQALYAEREEAKKKLIAAVRNCRELRAQVRELTARVDNTWQIERVLDKAAADEKEAVMESELGARLSALVLELLSRHTDGLTVAEMADFFGESVKRSTISATLYNMKKRNQIIHSETTGKYRLSQRSNFQNHATYGTTVVPR